MDIAEPQQVAICLVKEVTMNVGIAGWPLRSAPVDCIAFAIRVNPSNLVEIPKDLLNSISVKTIYGLLRDSGKDVSLAGTTDFANLSGLEWNEYSRYLDIQVAQARFIGCRMVRAFLGALNQGQLEIALSRLHVYARTVPDMEILIETHQGWESRRQGLAFCLANSSARFVIDFDNVADTETIEFIMNGTFADRIAYFHLRHLPGQKHVRSLAAVEERAGKIFSNHSFLWEPKTISGRRALKMYCENRVGLGNLRSQSLSSA
jgi:hypothetical protein